VASACWLVFGLVCGGCWCLGFVVWVLFLCVCFYGEFDPGSGRTLAACLTHASRAVRPFGVHERRTGE
jgi:hypothetical protein